MNQYFKKYGFQPLKITTTTSRNTELIVVIPCFNEKEIIKTLNSLNSNIEPRFDVEIIIVINQSEVASDHIIEQNKTTYNEIVNWEVHTNPFFNIHLIYEESLPKKHAGVGLARKIGMDEAAMRFESINKDGVIVCLDADCTVENNYFIEIEKHFKNNVKSPGCSIKYAHPIVGNDFDASFYEGIINYELFLRYYNLALAYSGAPYAYHTVGSSMAVKSIAYQKQGGMNKRKAGEDFYFLHKIIELGDFTELNSTTVYPSPRTSDRVPFGTGKAINDYLNQENRKEYLTYNFSSFIELKSLFDDIEFIYKSDRYKAKSESLLEFLKLISFDDKIAEIKANTTNLASFKKRFFSFFNAFSVLKYVHFVRDNFYSNNEIKEEVIQLLKLTNYKDYTNFTKQQLLVVLREIENK